MAKLTGKNALICGDARTIRVTFPYDITGHTVFFTVRDESTLNATNDSNALIAKVVTSHFSPTAGITDIELTKEDTRIPAGVHVFDIQDVNAEGEPSSVPYANIEFKIDVTKNTS